MLSLTHFVIIVFLALVSITIALFGVNTTLMSKFKHSDQSGKVNEILMHRVLYPLIAMNVGPTLINPVLKFFMYADITEELSGIDHLGETQVDVLANSIQNIVTSAMERSLMAISLIYIVIEAPLSLSLLIKLVPFEKKDIAYFLSGRLLIGLFICIFFVLSTNN